MFSSHFSVGIPQLSHSLSQPFDHFCLTNPTSLDPLFQRTILLMSEDPPPPPNAEDPPVDAPPDDADDKDQKDTKKKAKKVAKKSVAAERRRMEASRAKLGQLPAITPHCKCRLRLFKLNRVKDWLSIEDEFITNCEKLARQNEADENTLLAQLDQIRGLPLSIATIEEIVNDDNAIISKGQVQYYVSICPIVDRRFLYPGVSVYTRARYPPTYAIVGVVEEDANQLVDAMKVGDVPFETYADIGGLEDQIVEIKEAVEVPLTHPEFYEEVGIRPPKGVILYGPPGTGKTLLARAVAGSTSATFLRIVGSELVQKYLCEGPRLVREVFRTAQESAPAIVFIDEIDAIGTKRYESHSPGEREVQRTMLELLNQLDGFDDRGEVKVIMATNRIDALDPALIRPGRIDRKIELPMPDMKTKLKIFQIHSAKMTKSPDVSLQEFALIKEDISGADVKAICTEAGLAAINDNRHIVTRADFLKAHEKVMYKKKENIPEGLYI
jgi:26S proteasome regulatory subunit T2